MSRTTYGVDEDLDAAGPVHRRHTARWWIAGIALALALAGTGYAVLGPKAASPQQSSSVPSEQEIQDKYNHYVRWWDIVATSRRTADEARLSIAKLKRQGPLHSDDKAHLLFLEEFVQSSAESDKPFVADCLALERTYAKLWAERGYAVRR